MVRATTVIVTLQELSDLFGSLSLWEKIQGSVLSTFEAGKKAAPSKSYPGATSQILKHFNSLGAQACTTHRIIDPTGQILHWDEVDIKAGDVTITKPALPSQP